MPTITLVENSQNPQTQPSFRMLVPAAILGVIVLATAGCGGSKTEAASGSGTSIQTTTTTAPASTTTAARQACTPANLQASVTAEYANATVLDVTCSTAFAVATLSSSRGTHLAYFGSQPDGTWAQLKISQLDADPVAEAPAGVPQSLATGWKAKYNARLARPNDTPESNSQMYGDVPPPPTTTTAPPPPPPPPPEELPPEELPPPTE